MVGGKIVNLNIRLLVNIVLPALVPNGIVPNIFNLMCVPFYWFLRNTEADRVSTTSELNLLREIIWMFTSPASNKYFTLDQNNLTIIVNKNVTINSCSQVGNIHMV